MHRHKRLLTAILILVFGLGVWTLAVVDFTNVASNFQDGETVSAAAFNDLFGAIDGNFDNAKEAIEQNREDIGNLQDFDSNLSTTSCTDGEAVQTIASDGTVSCASLPVSPSVVPAVSVTRSANLSVNHNAATKVPFDAEFFDTADMHSDTTNNTRLTATEAGIYQVSANVTWANNTTGIRQIAVLRNNDTRMGETSTAAGFMSQGVSGLLLLEEGDFVELSVFQDSGVALELVSTAPLKLEMVKVASAP